MGSATGAVPAACGRHGARSNAAPIFEVGEGALDQIAAFVDCLVKRRNVLAGRVRLDDGSGSPVGQELPQIIAVISRIAEQMFRLRECLDQTWRGAAIAHLARAELKSDQAPTAVGDRMDFRGPSATTAANCLTIGPPFPPALQR